MSAGHKWLAIATDIALYEVDHASDGELLSEFCDRWIDRHPRGARLGIVSVGTLLTLHLANLLPPGFDVISQQFWQRNHVLLRQLVARRSP